MSHPINQMFVEDLHSRLEDVEQYMPKREYALVYKATASAINDGDLAYAEDLVVAVEDQYNFEKQVENAISRDNDVKHS